MSLGSDSGNPTGLGSALTLTPEQQAAIQQRSVAFNNAVAPAAFAPNINNFPSYQSQAATQGTINPQPATYTSPIYVPQMTQAPQLPGNPNIFYSPLGAQQYGAGLGFVTRAPQVNVGSFSPDALAAQQAAAAAAYANTPAGRAAAAAAAARAGGAGGANGANGGNAANNNGVSTGSGWGGMEGGGGDGIGSDSDDGATGDNGAEGVDSDAAAAAAASDSDSDSDSDGASDGDGGGDGGGE